MLSKILVPIDGSKHSEKALQFACDVASKFDAAVHIVHVPQGIASDRVMVLGGASIVIHADKDEIEKAGRQLIDAATELAEKTVPGKVATQLRAGDPAAEIVDCAKEIGADCIVIGSRGLGDFAGLLLGSVSHKVCHAAPCTCITVR